MLKIRLTRVGKKRQPHYRVVVADAEAPRDGRIVEQIGHYNPLTDPATVDINEARALHWLSVGAQPTNAVRDLLKKQGTYSRLVRLHAGAPLEELVAEYTGEPVAKAGLKATPQAAEVVEEPETEIGEAYLETEAEEEEEAYLETEAEEEEEAYLETEAEEEETVVEEIVDAVGDAAEDTVETVTDTVRDIVDVVLDRDEEE